MQAWTLILIGGLLAGCVNAPAQNLRTLSVSLKTPNPCWRIQLTEIYRDGEALFAVSELTPPRSGVACPQVIATATSRVTLKLPPLPVRHLVLGQTWDWGADQGYERVVGRVALERRLAGAELLFRLGEGETRPGDGVL